MDGTVTVLAGKRGALDLEAEPAVRPWLRQAGDDAGDAIAPFERGRQFVGEPQRRRARQPLPKPTSASPSRPDARLATRARRARQAGQREQHARRHAGLQCAIRCASAVCGLHGCEPTSARAAGSMRWSSQTAQCSRATPPFAVRTPDLSNVSTASLNWASRCRRLAAAAYVPFVRAAVPSPGPSSATAWPNWASTPPFARKGRAVPAIDLLGTLHAAVGDLEPGQPRQGDEPGPAAAIHRAAPVTNSARLLGAVFGDRHRRHGPSAWRRSRSAPASRSEPIARWA